MNIGKILNEIQITLKNSFKFVDDPEGDVWTPPNPDWTLGKKFSGDCDDYCLHARKVLDDRGIPSRFVICRIKGPMFWHGVIESHGYILNCNYDNLRTIEEASKGHVWHAISGYKRNDPWHLIAGVRDTRNQP